ITAVGGGVVGDLAGFAAAPDGRCLPLLMVPTTLLAMVYSSAGGKGAVTHPAADNLLGAFRPPAAVGSARPTASPAQSPCEPSGGGQGGRAPGRGFGWRA